MIDYGGGTEQVEEWSSHSSEEDTDQEANEQGQQEEEEEAGVMEDEETSMRLRSRATHAKVVTHVQLLPSLQPALVTVQFPPPPGVTLYLT